MVAGQITMNTRSSSLNNLYVKIIQSVVILIAFFVGTCALFFSMFTATEWVECLSKIGVAAEAVDHVKNQYMNPINYYHTRIMFWLLFGMGCVFSTLIFRFRNALSQVVKEIFPVLRFYLKSIFWPSSNSRFEQRMINLSFVVVIGLISVGFLFYPLSVDELSSFLFFVDRGFHVSLVYYPSPNNHVLFNLMATGVSMVSGSAVVIMKVSAFVIASFVLRTIQVVFIQWFPLITGNIAFVFLGLNFNVAYYSVHGRGYMLVLGLTLVLLFSVWKIIIEGERKWSLVAAFAIAFGLYTIPIFLYPLIAVGLWGVGVALFRKKYRDAILIVTAVTFGCWIAGVMYVPILLFNGIESLIGNKWVEQLNWEIISSNYLSYFRDLNNWVWDMDFGGGLFSAGLVTLVVIFYRRHKHVLWGLLIAVLVPLSVVGIQHVLPFYRVWICWLIPLAIGFGVIVNHEKIPKVLIWGVLVLLVINYARGIYRVIDGDELLFYKGTEEMIEEVVFKDGPVFSEDDTYSIYCRYGFYLDGRPFPKIELGEFGSSDGYQTLILTQPIQNKIQGFQLVYFNENVGVFERLIPWTAP